AAVVDEPGFEVVGEAGNGEEARRLCEELAPEVLVLDADMPGAPLSETMAVLADRCPEVKVLVLTDHWDGADAERFRAAGAVGCVAKDGEVEKLVEALHAVVEGGEWFD
ncbi:MAG: response regulator transcription factor, partial [Chloroflexota bacterium]|nr:response regulator transcription factor [Chloroflexota bacterium]